MQSQSGSSELHNFIAKDTARRGPLHLHPSDISCARRLFSGSEIAIQDLELAVHGGNALSPNKQAHEFTPFSAEECWQPTGLVIF